MGNDQVRFDLAVKALGDYEIVAPIREIQKEHTEVRAYEQKYLEARGFGVRAKQKAYTINENLLGLTMSGGEIDRWQAPGERCARLVQRRVRSGRRRRLQVRIGFEQGEAVALDGRSAWPAHAILADGSTRVSHAYGVGRGLYTGDTTIGLKGRIIFEAPGLIALLTPRIARWKKRC
jgi:argininosuccinate synthase